ncbi:MAG TPA: hypothetical protein VN031_01640 [Candidatus Microsaccharimonas sp.]|nr:hypothetical protein [Candidatus Microsaccharimonas sp.]
MKHLRKLNTKGFGHVELLVVVITIAVIGGIGSYVMLRKSHADISAATVCGRGYTGFNNGAVGSQLDHNGKVGPARVYWLHNTTAQKICAVVISSGSAYGVSKPMKVSITYTNPRTTTTVASNRGNFKYYAGPIYVSTSNNACRYEGIGVASMTWKGVVYSEGPLIYPFC